MLWCIFGDKERRMMEPGKILRTDESRRTIIYYFSNSNNLLNNNSFVRIDDSGARIGSIDYELYDIQKLMEKIKRKHC
jgi:hypothetical protein